MKQKIIDILQPNMIPEVAELKADQIMELFKAELNKAFELLEKERYYIFKTYCRMNYENTK